MRGFYEVKVDLKPAAASKAFKKVKKALEEAITLSKPKKVKGRREVDESVDRLSFIATDAEAAKLAKKLAPVKPHMVWRKCSNSECGCRWESKAREDDFQCPACNGPAHTERSRK